MLCELPANLMVPILNTLSFPDISNVIQISDQCYELRDRLSIWQGLIDKTLKYSAMINIQN